MHVERAGSLWRKFFGSQRFGTTPEKMKKEEKERESFQTGRPANTEVVDVDIIQCLTLNTTTLFGAATPCRHFLLDI